MLNILSALACVIIFAKDNPAHTIIRQHEIGHCNGWIHKYRVEGIPPKEYNHPFKGRLYEQPVSTAEAHERCGGLIGKELLGCSTGSFQE